MNNTRKNISWSTWYFIGTELIRVIIIMRVRFKEIEKFQSKLRAIFSPCWILKITLFSEDSVWLAESPNYSSINFSLLINFICKKKIFSPISKEYP